MSKKSGGRLRKLVRGFLWFLLVVLISLNLFVVLSGRFYLYKGVYYTYLSGEKSATIYDKDKFYSSTLPKSKQPQPWKLNPDSQAIKIPADMRSYMESYGTSSFLVFRGDSLLFEEYWGDHNATTVSNSFSAAKTVVSMLIGIAIQERAIKSIDDRVSKYLPKFSGKGKEKVTIRHLLMMASGLSWEESSSNPLSENAESYYGSDLWGLINRERLISKPGKLFFYQSGNSQILGFVLEKATGKDLSAYADEKLWQPMGAESDAFWSLDKKNGDEKAFCCLYSTSRDFARLGKLVNQGGKWGKRQLIPKWYYDEMIANPEMETEEGIPNTRYGLHIWTYHGYKNPVYYCRGIHGQYIISIPAENLVIVRTGKKRAKNLEVPEDPTEKAAFLRKYKEKVGHPKDLFRYIELGRSLAKQAG